MLCNGNGIGSYPKDRKRLLEVVGINYGQSLKLPSQALQLTVEGYKDLDEDSDSDNPHTSDGYSQGSYEKMDDPVWFSEGRRRRLSSSSMKALEGVVGEVMKNVRAAGYGEAVCTEFHDHFASLPSRYSFFIHDYLLHSSSHT